MWRRAQRNEKLKRDSKSKVHETGDEKEWDMSLNAWGAERVMTRERGGHEGAGVIPLASFTDCTGIVLLWHLLFQLWAKAVALLPTHLTLIGEFIFYLFQSPVLMLFCIL